MKLIFHGVRGTIPTALPSHMQVGGNTSCVEVRCAGTTFFFDAGSGIYWAGRKLEEEGRKEPIHILLSHTHIDHILGLPLFMPAYHSDYDIHFWAGHLLPQMQLQDAIDRLMSPPLFPLTREDFKANICFHNFIAGETLSHTDWSDKGITMETIALHHPDRATGYRLSCGGKSVCYITDIEHTDGILDEALVDFIQHTDCLIYDSTYSDEEFSKHKGWGHSTWQHAMGLGEKANVKQVALFHHHQDRTDSDMQKREKELQKMPIPGFIAREGAELVL